MMVWFLWAVRALGVFVVVVVAVLLFLAVRECLRWRGLFRGVLLCALLAAAAGCESFEVAGEYTRIGVRVQTAPFPSAFLGYERKTVNVQSKPDAGSVPEDER